MNSVLSKRRCSQLITRWSLVLLGLLLVWQTGCVTRRLTMRSNPPGARVYVGDEEIGTTPVSHDFTYYGTRKIRLVKDGYETLIVNQPIPAPWYQIPPLDFVSENLVPGEIRDERVVTYEMTPLQLQSKEQILQKANALRSASLGRPMTTPINNSGGPNLPSNSGVETIPTPPRPGAETLPPPANQPQWQYPLPPGAPRANVPLGP
jgi:hypothetical protein